MTRSPRSTRSRRGVTAAVAVGLLAAAPSVAFAADGGALLGGARNPAGGTAHALGHETQVIADTPRDSYGTRQSNKGLGGGAIYGCRSLLGANLFDPASSTPCVRAACRGMLERTLHQAIAAAADPAKLYKDPVCASPAPMSAQECFDAISFNSVGINDVPLLSWVNRPTYQEAVEIPGHRPR